jgi:regulatory protein
VIITAVERAPKRRNRVDVYVDGVRTFDVTLATARRTDLRPGRPLHDDEIARIIADDRRRAALQAAASLLARRPRSERELRQRLIQRRFDTAIADETIARLRELRLLDDTEFARTWTEARDAQSPRGRRLIVQELRARGVDAAVARDAASSVSDGDAAYRLASRRMRSLAGLDHDAFRTRLAGLLQRRGFGWSVVAATIERCWTELGGAPVEDDLPAPVE